MNRYNLIVATFLLAALSLVPFGAASAQGVARPDARAIFMDSTGLSIGAAELTDMGQGVLIELEITSLPPARWVAFHIHETGMCDPAEGHKSAGGHFALPGEAHGYLDADGPHAGDMPNQYVASDGTLRAQVFNSTVRLADGEADIRGRALMIHADPDDHESQPSGAAGARLACAVIE